MVNSARPLASVMSGVLELVRGDLTRQPTDAVVNAANMTLLGGGGVDGALHRAAGPRLRAACQALPETAPGVRCPTGEVRLTPGFDLPAHWVIHTVGPRWRGGDHKEPELLAACYRRALEMTLEPALVIHSLAFPAISTGAYGYPLTAATRIALGQILAFLEGARGNLERVVCVCFDSATLRVYQEQLERLKWSSRPGQGQGDPGAAPGSGTGPIGSASEP